MMPALDLGLASHSPVPARNAHHVISALLMKVVLCPSQTTQKPLQRGQGSRVQGQPPANGRDRPLGKRQGWWPRTGLGTWSRVHGSRAGTHTFPQLEAERAREAKATHPSRPGAGPALLTPGQALCPTPPYGQDWWGCSLGAGSATPPPWDQEQTFTSWASACSSDE